MQWFLACALLIVTGCGESEEEQGVTVVTITFPPETGHHPYPDVTCEGDPPGVVHAANPCEFIGTDKCVLYLSVRAGPCTLPIGVYDDTTGERICVQEEDFVVSEVGDTEVHVTIDCEAVATP